MDKALASGGVERLLAHNTSKPCKEAIKLLGAAPTDFVLELHTTHPSKPELKSSL